MELKTKYSCGDKVWYWSHYRNCPVVGTVGQVRVEFTKSVGINNGAVESGCDIQFDNYKPQMNYEESYMLEETGIGSGNIYYVDRLFATREEVNAPRSTTH